MIPNVGDIGICIDTRSYKALTLGRGYRVLDIYKMPEPCLDGLLHIYDDIGNKRCCYFKRFNFLVDLSPRLEKALKKMGYIDE